MSRARGSKAQKRMQQYIDIPQNTIDFIQAKRNRHRQLEIRPKTRTQEKLLLDLMDPSAHIVVTIGPAGTGKSYLAILSALQDLKYGKCDKIVLTRPAVGVENENHGFLPGNLIQKMEPWTRPLIDIMKEFYHITELNKMIQDETIEIAPLAFMRGRTFKNCRIIADEMQNATPNQIKMLLTRIGPGSKIIVTGDIDQTDKNHGTNGLLDLSHRLERTPTSDIRMCKFTARDIQRHPIIDHVLQIYSD